MIDLTAELTTWLRADDVRGLLKGIVAEAVRDEIRVALEDELLDVVCAARILGMTEGALRKAVERGQVPCERIGHRLRFRRMDLLASGSEMRRAANTNAGSSTTEPRLLTPGREHRRATLRAPRRAA